MDITEVKSAVDQMHRAFEEFKKTNDERLAAIKAGESTAKFDEKLARMTESLDKSEKTQAEYLRKISAIEEKSKAFEATLNRIELASGGSVNPERRAAEMKALDTFLRGGVERLSADEKKVLTVANDTTGGYLAPAMFLADIIKAEVLYTPVRDLVTVRTIGTGEFIQPKRTTTAAATRVGEVASRSETQNPAWGEIRINAPEMYAEARVSQQNLEDSAFNLEQILTEEFGEQFGVKEGAEFVTGTGVNQMLGITDANAAGPSTAIANTHSGSAATIAGASGAQADGIIDLFHAVKTAYAAMGKWILNRASLGKVRKLKDANGQYLWQPGVGSSNPPTILGAPYVECPDMPDEGANAYPIGFGDWKRAYTMVERVDMMLTRDPFTLASSGQVKFTARRRVGGKVVLGEAVRLLKCAA